MAITLYIPTINDYLGDFDVMARLWHKVQEGNESEVMFDFSQCRFLRQNAVAFLGGLARMIEYRGGKAIMNWETLHDDVGRNLGKNGFRDAFGDVSALAPGESIPYRQDLVANRDEQVSYLRSQWLGRGKVNVSPQLCNVIVGNVWEIYANAFEHAGSPVGLFSCGQHFPRKHELTLTFVDFGVGIPSNVRRFLGDERYPAAKAMQWAFREGTTTKPDDDIGRGVGLKLLKQFVQLNKGQLEVFSHEGYTRVTKDGECHDQRQAYFEGTLVNIRLVCNDSRYCLVSELQPRQPFF